MEAIYKPLPPQLYREFKSLLGSAGQAPRLLEILRSLDPIQRTRLLQGEDTEHMLYCLDLLDSSEVAFVLKNFPVEVLRMILPELETQKMSSYIDHLKSDDAADMLVHLSYDQIGSIIAKIRDESKSNHILDLLQYEEDVAGGLMQKEFISVKGDWNIRQCITEIRKNADKVGKIFSVFAVDNHGNLKGAVGINELILSDEDTLVSQISAEIPVSVDVFARDQEVARIMQEYDLEVIPVINSRGRLLGRITIDDVLDVITMEAKEDQERMSGITSHLGSPDTVWGLSRTRLPWLIVGMMGGMVAAKIGEFFSMKIEFQAGIAFFIPLIMATAGNVGVQTSTLLVQMLDRQPLGTAPRIRGQLARSLLVSVVNGVILSALSWLAIVALLDNQQLAMIVGISLLAIVILSTLTGTLAPMIFSTFKINPALASGPFITTTNDILALFFYFLIASLIPQG